VPPTRGERPVGWVSTEELTPGTRVLLGNHGLIRTVASVELSELCACTSCGEETVYTVRYVEGNTEEWPSFNRAAGWVQWPTPGRRKAPGGPGLWDEGDPIEWDPLPPTEDHTRDQEADDE
jgi:hypothetical protein